MSGEILKYYPLVLTALLAGCVVAPPPRVVYVAPRPPVYVPPPAPEYAPPQMVVSVYEEPPISQPEPILVRWAPPPMLVESPYEMPYSGAVWIGGYWVWNGNWVWAHGHWAGAPRPSYYWVQPYYENRGGNVVFITGYWSPPAAVFVAPSLSLTIGFAAVSVGVVAGPAVIGPSGVFVPAPPGSRLGIVVSAPIGTSPAVVTSAPPVVNVGMRIQKNVNSNNITNSNNVTNNVTNNITNVTIVAPASATANGQAVNAAVPAQAHMAAAMRPVVNAMAPKPSSSQAIPAYSNARALVSLPPPQMVRASSTPNAASQNNAPPRPVVQPAAQPVVPAVASPTPVSSIANQSPPGNQGATLGNAKNFPATLPQQASQMSQAVPAKPSAVQPPQPNPSPADQAKAKRLANQQATKAAAKARADAQARAKVDAQARAQAKAAAERAKQQEREREKEGERRPAN